MVIKPMIRNSICINAHPEGCLRQVDEQIAYVREKGSIDGIRSALIIGASTGYGLASRIVASFACGAPTIGVYYERADSKSVVNLERRSSRGAVRVVAIRMHIVALEVGLAGQGQRHRRDAPRRSRN